MEYKKIIIIVVLLIIVAAAIAGIMFLQTNNAKEPMEIKITSNKTQYEGGKLSLQLTNSNKTPISGEIVNITITDSKGKVVVDDVVKTNSKGNAKIDLNLKKGKYDVNVTYGGNKNYSGNNTTQKLTIKEKEVDTSSSSSNSQSSSDDYVYSPQKGGYVKKSGQWDTDSKGNKIHSYQGSDGVIYEEYYDSKGNKMSSEDFYR